MPIAIAVLLLAQLADILTTYYAITTHPGFFTEGNPIQQWFGWEGVGVIKVGVTAVHPISWTLLGHWICDATTAATESRYTS